MASAEDVQQIALSLEGSVAAPHMERVAYKVVRTYATLAPDQLTINLKLTPDEQEFKTLLAPAIYSVIPTGWGRMGWTTAILAPMSRDELDGALRMAWTHGREKRSRR